MSETPRPARSHLAARTLLWYAFVFVAVMATFSAVVTTSVRRVLEHQIVVHLEDAARLIAVEMGPSDQIQARVAAYAVASEARVSVIGSDGTVLADSAFDPETMENHRTRPEVVDALAGRVGTDRRVSATLGDERLYVAIPPDAEGRIVRLSVTAAKLDADLATVGQAVLRAALALGALGLALVWFVAHRMARPIRELTEMADQVASGSLDIRPRRSSVFELDRLGISIGRIASQLGRRITETEEERRTLALVLGALTQGVILVGGSDDVIYANQAAGQVLGPIPSKATALVPRGLIHCIRRARLDGRVVEEELEHGSPARTLISIATPFEDDARVMVMVVDVTERRRVEAMRRDFVADASHELKTPVAAILASSEALQMAVDRDPSRAGDFARRVEASARQLSRIVADLLDLSRLESSEPSPDLVAFDEVVRSEVAGVQRRAAENGISLTSNVADVDVIGDAADLALAVRNLCDNAIRFTDSNGSVKVSLQRLGDQAVLRVSDTGTGIPTRALGRVFERFYRVDEARSRATGGTGLGLAIVKHVVERHGGSVSVESQLGAGSTFTIELPIASDGPSVETPDPTAASTD